MKVLLYAALFVTSLLSSELSLKTPKEAVRSYYNAMNSADIESLHKIMVPSSFEMTMEVWALSKALQNKAFAQVLKAYGKSPEINAQVHHAVQVKLQNSNPKLVANLIAIPLGKSRCIVRYKEDGKEKQLYTSLHEKRWKIDYKAGRKVD